MPTAASRYAEALVDLALQESALEEYRAELGSVSEVLQREAELKSFLLDPRTDISDKKKLFTGVFENSLKPNTLHFMLLLLDKEALSILPDIVRGFDRMSDAKQHVLNLTIESALPLDPSHIEEICNKFRTLLNYPSAKADVRIRPELIGGVKVTAGDTVYDGTVKGKLSKLQEIISG